MPDKPHKPKGKALVAMRTAFAVWMALFPQFGFAYSHRLTDSEVRDAYFLGQDSERATAFLSQYVQTLPVPNSGPHVAQIELRTPYAQVVAVSQQHPTGYSAQQAAEDYKARGNTILIRAQVMFTPTYSNRPDDFWRDVSIRLVQGDRIAPKSVSGQPVYTGQPIYTTNRDGTSWVIGAEINAVFDVSGLSSDSVQVEVVTPEGPPVHATFELDKLH
jgi:hypothetical protein